jgi:hypothetical protein
MSLPCFSSVSRDPSPHILGIVGTSSVACTSQCDCCAVCWPYTCLRAVCAVFWSQAVVTMHAPRPCCCVHAQVNTTTCGTLTGRPASGVSVQHWSVAAPQSTEHAAANACHVGNTGLRWCTALSWVEQPLLVSYNSWCTLNLLLCRHTQLRITALPAAHPSDVT